MSPKYVDEQLITARHIVIQTLAYIDRLNQGVGLQMAGQELRINFLANSAERLIDEARARYVVALDELVKKLIS